MNNTKLHIFGIASTGKAEKKRKEKTWFVYDGRKRHWAEERAMRFDVL